MSLPPNSAEIGWLWRLFPARRSLIRRSEPHKIAQERPPRLAGFGVPETG
jgi:hypothetical protein